MALTLRLYPELVKFFLNVVVEFAEENVIQGLTLLLHEGFDASGCRYSPRAKPRQRRGKAKQN